jgi:uncharacterized SAM-binding protein YcdF (DUF218 family)
MVLNGDRDSRPFVAAALANTGFAGQVLVPRKTHPADSPWPAEHGVTQEILRLRGVAADRIRLIGDPCESTFDEATALATFLESRPPSSITVVTSDYHSRRTRWMFRQVLAPDVVDALGFVTAPTERFSADNWWLVEDGFLLYGTEYLKLLAYWLQYGNGLLWCGAVAVAALVFCGWRFAAQRSLRRRRARTTRATTAKPNRFAPSA